MTNEEKLEQIGIDVDSDEAREYAENHGLCDCCNEYIEKNLPPWNPVCEGSWCDEAFDYWLDEEAEGGED